MKFNLVFLTILLLIFFDCKVKNKISDFNKTNKNYILLLENKKWYYTDGPTGKVKYPCEYLKYDEKYEYYFVNDSLHSKDLYHFSNSRDFDLSKIGKLKYGEYMVFEDEVCREVEAISDSIFSYWFYGAGTFNILEAK